MDYDEMIRGMRRGFTEAENSFDLTIHELYGRLSRLDLLTRPELPPAPEAGEDTVAVTVPVAVYGPRAVYGPLTRPHAEPIIPAVVELHASLPWWRRWLRRIDRRFARNLEVAS